jgi:hypothetical protein
MDGTPRSHMSEIGLSQIGGTPHSLRQPPRATVWVMRTGDLDVERAVVRLVLQRERELAGLERLLGSGAVSATKTLAADGVVKAIWAMIALKRYRSNPTMRALDGDADGLT